MKIWNSSFLDNTHISWIIISYSEQKLLNRIKNELKRTKQNKILYVIHNLMTYTSIEQVKNYIKETCLKSATFQLERQDIINNGKIKEREEKGEGVCFFEKNTKHTIKHLIFACEGSEAGKYYNTFTLDYLEKSYSVNIESKPFDVLETVKKKFQKSFKRNIRKNWK